jgi:EmrB/QacA subfamily drug resistance transporter
MPEAGGPAAAFSHKEVLRILSGVLLCMLMASLDQTVLATALPAIAADFHGVPYLSWCITAYLLASTVATLIFGKLSDLWGRRVLLEASIGIFLLASIACALAPNMAALIAARAVQGIGGGGLYSMAQASIADVVSARERGRYQAYITSAFSTAAIIGPVIGGFCVEYLTWRWAFWINLPVGAIAFFFVAWALKRIPVKKERRKIDFLGVALMVPGVAAWMLVCAWGGVTYPWSSPMILGLGGVGLCFLLAFALQELRAREALLPPRLFVNPNIRTVLITQFLIASTLLSTALLLPVFLQLVAGYTASQSGGFMIPLIGSQMVGSITTGYRMRATGRYKRSPQAGFIGIMISFILYATMTATTPYWLIAIYFMVNGIAVGLCMSPMTVAGQNAADFRDLGAFTGTSGFFRSLGGSFGTALLWTALVLAFGHFLAGAPLGIGPEVLRGGPGALADLPPDVRATILPDLTHAFAITFGIAAAIAFLGFVAISFLEEVPLKTVAGKAPAERAGE